MANLYGGALNPDDSDHPPPPSYSSISYPSAPTFGSDYESRFIDPMSPSSRRDDDLSSVVKRLEKKLEVCENRIQENETEIQRLKTDHRREIEELRQQMRNLGEGGESSASYTSKVTHSTTPSGASSFPGAIYSSIPYSFPSSTIALQGCHQGWFVSAQPNGTVECNRKNLDIWETITVEKAKGGDQFVYLRSYHRKYLSSQPNGQLQWNRENRDGWERFEVYHLGGDTIGLKSCHGKWVSAQPDGRIEVNRDVLGPWEQFVVHISTKNSTAPLPPPFSFPSNQITLQGYHKKWFVRAQENGTVACNSKKVGNWEVIKIEKDGDRHVYLKSYHDKYLSAQQNGQLQWNRDAKKGWERFEVRHVEGNKIGLKSCHGKWVSAQPDGRLEVNRDVLSIWEHFTVH